MLCREIEHLLISCVSCYVVLLIGSKNAVGKRFYCVSTPTHDDCKWAKLVSTFGSTVKAHIVIGAKCCLSLF